MAVDDSVFSALRVAASFTLMDNRASRDGPSKSAHAVCIGTVRSTTTMMAAREMVTTEVEDSDINDIRLTSTCQRDQMRLLSPADSDLLTHARRSQWWQKAQCMNVTSFPCSLKASVDYT